MMGYPQGWCDHLEPPEALKAYGNSVCTQQAAVAVPLLEDALATVPAC